MIKRTALKVTVLALAAVAHRCAPAPEARPAEPVGPHASVEVLDCSHARMTGAGFEPGSPIELQFGSQPPLAYTVDADGSFSHDVPRSDGLYVAVGAISQVSTGFYTYADFPPC